MGHTHEHNQRVGSRELKISLTITATYMVVEAIGGYLTHSLALLADAGHMLSAVGSLGLSLLALRFAAKPRTARMSYGYYRAEILAALVNGVTLVVISVLIFYEAITRFQSPRAVQSGTMLAVAIVGLFLNLFSAYILSRNKGVSLNVRGAYMHVLADTLGSVGAIAAGIIMLTTGWYVADPIISIIIGILILFSSWRLLKESVTVLMEGTPPHVDVKEIGTAMKTIPSVVEVHDLHIWTVTSGFDALSAHIAVENCNTMAEAQNVLSRMQELIREKFGIEHATIQIERVGWEMKAEVMLPP